MWFSFYPAKSFNTTSSCVTSPMAALLHLISAFTYSSTRSPSSPPSPPWPLMHAQTCARVLRVCVCGCAWVVMRCSIVQRLLVTPHDHKSACTACDRLWALYMNITLTNNALQPWVECWASNVNISFGPWGWHRLYARDADGIRTRVTGHTWLCLWPDELCVSTHFYPKQGCEDTFKTTRWVK